MGARRHWRGADAAGGGRQRGAGLLGALDLAAAVRLHAALALGARGPAGIVAARVPANAVGWLLLVLGVGIGLPLAGGAYAELSVTTDEGPLPATSGRHGSATGRRS